MKNMFLIIIVAAIAYSCATFKTQDEKAIDRNRIAQERITILKEAETSNNPAILQQAELVRAQIKEETEPMQMEEMEKWAQRNSWTFYFVSLSIGVFFIFGFTLLKRMKETASR